MAARRTAKVRIEGEDRLTPTTKKAERGFRKFTKTVGTAGVAAFGAFTAAAAAAGATIATVFKAVTDAENATNRLNSAVEAAGQTTETSTASFLAWADALQKTTTLSAEQAKEGAALALQFGATNEGARELATVAADFAVGAGLNYTEAVRRLGRAMQGSTDDVAKFAPEIRNLTKEQLAAGAATRALGEAMSGQAAAGTETLSGSITQLGNAFNSLLAELFGATEGVGGLTEGIKSLTKFISSSSALKALRLELKAIIIVVNAILVPFKLWLKTLTAISNYIVNFFVPSAKDIESQFFTVREQAERTNRSYEEMEEKLRFIRLENDLASKSTKDLADEQAELVKVQQEREAEDLRIIKATVRLNALLDERQRRETLVAEAVEEETEEVIAGTVALRTFSTETGASAQAQDALAAATRGVTQALVDQATVAPTVSAGGGDSRFATNFITGDRSTISQVGGGQFTSNRRTVNTQVGAGRTQQT